MWRDHLWRDHRGDGWRYSTDDRLMAAVTSGYLVCGVTLVPAAILLTVLDVRNPLVVVAWVLLPGVVGFVAPGWFAALIRPRYTFFGRHRPGDGSGDG
jgi:hypothetical protein